MPHVGCMLARWWREGAEAVSHHRLRGHRACLCAGRSLRRWLLRQQTEARPRARQAEPASSGRQAGERDALDAVQVRGRRAQRALRAHQLVLCAPAVLLPAAPAAAASGVLGRGSAGAGLTATAPDKGWPGTLAWAQVTRMHARPAVYRQKLSKAHSHGPALRRSAAWGAGPRTAWTARPRCRRA